MCKHEKEITYTIIVQSHQSPLSTSALTRTVHHSYIDTRDDFSIGSITWYDQVCMHSEIQYGYSANWCTECQLSSYCLNQAKRKVSNPSCYLTLIYFKWLNHRSLTAKDLWLNLCDTAKFYGVCSIRVHRSNVAETEQLDIEGHWKFKRLLRHSTLDGHGGVDHADKVYSYT